jgi:hypothetical protein
MDIRLFVALCLMSFSSFAQQKTFLGRVIDKESKEGVPYCVVKVKDRNEGVYTDENGRFAFTANRDSEQLFIFYCMGYGRQEIAGSQFGTDSLIIALQKEVSALKEVVIKDVSWKGRSGYIGKKKSKHTGDCYQTYGEEIAVYLKRDKRKTGILKEVSVYITDEGAPDSKFRIHIYGKDSVTNLPAQELTDSNLIVHGTTGNEWVKVDFSNKRIPVKDGVFISVEWIAGHGNTDSTLQSAKHAEVRNLNGQVLGLTRNSWKGKGSVKYVYHKNPFSNDWSVTFPHAYSPILCPMIYGKYIYYKD